MDEQIIFNATSSVGLAYLSYPYAIVDPEIESRREIYRVSLYMRIQFKSLVRNGGSVRI